MSIEKNGPSNRQGPARRRDVDVVVRQKKSYSEWKGVLVAGGFDKEVAVIERGSDDEAGV